MSFMGYIDGDIVKLIFVIDADRCDPPFRVLPGIFDRVEVGRSGRGEDEVDPTST